MSSATKKIHNAEPIDGFGHSFVGDCGQRGGGIRGQGGTEAGCSGWRNDPAEWMTHSRHLYVKWEMEGVVAGNSWE